MNPKKWELGFHSQPSERERAFERDSMLEREWERRRGGGAYRDLTMAEQWRLETERVVVDSTRTPTPGSTTRAGRATARGVEHAMEGGRRPKASSETRGARRPETLMGRVWLRGVNSDLEGSIPC